MQPVAYIGLSWNQRINLLFANTVTHSHCKWMCMRRLSPCIESSCNAVDRLCVLSGWRVVMLKFFIRRSPTSTSFICMKAVFCHSSSPTAASGLSALAKIICWTPGGRRTEPASSRWIKKYFNLLWPPQSNGPLYSNTVIGILAIDGWVVTVWYNEEGTGWGQPLLANVTAHSSTASVLTSYYLMWLYNCLWNLKG